MPGHSRRRTPINAQTAQGHEVLRLGDPLAADFLLRQLKDHWISPELSRLIEWVPGFESFAYRVERPFVKALADAPGKVAGFEVYHQGFHTLFGERFGVKLSGRPLTSLLNECQGQGSEIYFLARLAARTDFDPADVDHIQNFKENDRALGRRSFRRLFQKALRDPFAVFKAVAFESFEVHRALFDLLRETHIDKRSPELLLARMAARLRHCEYLIFYMHFDLSVPAFFIANYCGFRSDAQDLANVEAALSILRKSESMIDYLRTLKRGSVDSRLVTLKKAA